MVLIAATAATNVGSECGFAVADTRGDGLKSSSSRRSDKCEHECGWQDDELRVHLLHELR
jgi:hypothetical protein